MKCAYIVVLFCVVLVNCVKDTVVYSTYPFKYPSPLKATIKETPNKIPILQISWNPVKNWKENDPIIGYKLVLWEMKGTKHFIHTTKNGEMKVEETIDESDRVPVGDPMIFIVTPNNRNVTIDVKKGTWYEYAALAFTQKEQGPLSPIGSGVKIHGKDST